MEETHPPLITLVGSQCVSFFRSFFIFKLIVSFHKKNSPQLPRFNRILPMRVFVTPSFRRSAYV